jgi:hypothetical protein
MTLLHYYDAKQWGEVFKLMIKNDISNRNGVTEYNYIENKAKHNSCRSKQCELPTVHFTKQY